MSDQVICRVRRGFRVLSFLTTAAALFSQLSFSQQGPLLNGIAASPDGQSVTFWSSVAPDGNVQDTSAVYSLGPGGRRPITPLGFALEATSAQLRPSAFSLFPNGTRLAVSTASSPFHEDETGDVRIIEMATGAARAIPVPGKADQVHVTPDGRTVLFSVPPFTGHYWFPFLYSVPVDGGPATRLARGAVDGRHPVADDGTIVFTSIGPSEEAITFSAPHDVYVMKTDGTGIRQLTRFSGSENAWQANITPDGKRILFTSTIPASPTLTTTTVWVMQADGQGRRSLPIDNRLEIVTFSADGSLVAWSLNGQVHVQNVDTGDDQVVAQFAQSDIAEMDFAPDNARLYLLVGKPSLYGPSTSYLPVGSSLWAVDLASKTAQPLFAPRIVSPSAIADSNSLTPGGFVTVYGSNLIRDGLLVPSTFPLPETLGGVSLSINGHPAPLLAVTPWQVNAQVPMDTPTGPVSLTLRFDDGTSTPDLAAKVVTIAPRVLGGCGFHGGTHTAVDPSHPAAPGEILEMYGTGLGVTNPIVPAGQPAPASPLPALVNEFGVGIASGNFLQTADVLWAGLSPGSIGLYQVNFRVPPQTPPGSAEIGWRTQGGGTFWQCSITVGN